MAGPRKDPKTLAAEWMPELPPEIRDQWVKQYAAPAMGAPFVTVTPGGKVQVNDTARATPPPPAPTAPPDAMTAALQASNRAPGSAPPPPPASPSLFSQSFTPRSEDAEGNLTAPATAPPSGAQPKGGDWKGRDKWVAGEDAKQRKANLEGATFATPASSGPAPGTMISPGGRTPASWTTQTAEGTKLSPQTYAAADKAEGSKMDAARWQERATETDADRELAILQGHQAAQEAHVLGLRQRADDQRARYEDELGKLQTMTDAVQGDQIEPDAWFKNQSAGAKFAIGLGRILVGGLGGLGAGMQGHGAENQGLKAINDGIREEIEAQKFNANLRGQRVGQQQSLLGQMSRTFDDEGRGEAATWLAYLEKAKTQLAAGATEAKSDYAQAKYRQALADVDSEIASRREKWDQLTKDHVTRVEHDVNAPAQYAGGAGGPLSKHDREEASAVAKELTERGIPQARAQLGDIERSIDTLGTEDIPGVGPIASHVPDILAKQVFGDRAIAGRQAVATIKNATRKSIAGASLSEGEKVELDKQLEGAHDAASLRRVVHSFRESIAAQEQTIRAMGSDSVNAEVTRRQDANKKYAVPLDKPSTPYLKPIE